MQKIVTLTINPTIDKSAEVAHVAADRKLRCESPRHEPGAAGSTCPVRLGGWEVNLWPFIPPAALSVRCCAIYWTRRELDIFRWR